MSRNDWRRRHESDAEYQTGADPAPDPDSLYVLKLDGDPAVCARCGYYIADERVEGPIPAAAFDYGSEGLLCERCMNERDGGTAPHGPA
jgi:hypothetical protein